MRFATASSPKRHASSKIAQSASSRAPFPCDFGGSRRTSADAFCILLSSFDAHPAGMAFDALAGRIHVRPAPQRDDLTTFHTRGITGWPLSVHLWILRMACLSAGISMAISAKMKSVQGLQGGRRRPQVTLEPTRPRSELSRFRRQVRGTVWCSTEPERGSFLPRCSTRPPHARYGPKPVERNTANGAIRDGTEIRRARVARNTEPIDGGAAERKPATIGWFAGCGNRWSAPAQARPPPCPCQALNPGGFHGVPLWRQRICCGRSLPLW